MKAHPEFLKGRSDALREAAAVLRAMEAAIEAKLGGAAAIRTRDARRLRRQAYGVAATRVETILRRSERGSTANLAAKVARLGF